MTLRPSDAGYATAAALGLLTALSLVASALVSTGLGELRRSRAMEDRAAVEALARGVLIRAADELAQDPRRRRVSFEDGRAQITLAERAFDVTVEDERAKLDLNAADIGSLAHDLRGAGLAHEAAGRVADAVGRTRAGFTELSIIDLVFDELSPTQLGCLRSLATVFGGRSQMDAARDRDAGGAQAVAGSAFAIKVRARDNQRGLARVVLMTGDPRDPFLVYDEWVIREGEECDG